MGDEVNLLRMLEPAVRPTDAARRAVRPATPIERQSFEQLLAQARQTQPDDGTSPAEQAVDRRRPMMLLDRLADAGHVQNPGARRAGPGAAARPAGTGGPMNDLNVDDPQAEPRVDGETDS